MCAVWGWRASADANAVAERQLRARLLSRHRRCPEDLLQIRFAMTQVWLYSSHGVRCSSSWGKCRGYRGELWILQEGKHLTGKMLENVIYLLVS